MKRRSLAIVLLGSAMVLGMIVFPPWTYSYFGPGGRQNTPLGRMTIPEGEHLATIYAPIFRPPRLWKAHLNAGRLLLQCGGVAAVTAYIAWRGER